MDEFAFAGLVMIAVTLLAMGVMDVLTVIITTLSKVLSRIGIFSSPALKTPHAVSRKRGLVGAALGPQCQFRGLFLCRLLRRNRYGTVLRACVLFG
jgi:hypothetical protein